MNATSRAIRHLKLTKSFAAEDSILLFADPRSGSTWLAEILNGMNGTCLVDEPLSLTNNPELNRLNFSWRQYIPPEAQWNEAKVHFQQLFRGSFLPPKSYANNSLVQLLRAKRAIFKIIRGKMLLPWLLQNFHFNHKPLLLVRHPFAVIHSMKQHPGWQYPFKHFSVPKSPYPEPYHTHLDFLTQLKTNAEQMLAYWCLANQNFLDTDQPQEVHMIRYEDLVADPQVTFSGLFASLELNAPADLDSRIKRLSSSSIQTKPKTTEDYLHGWRKHIDALQLSQYHEIINYFGIDLSYFE